MADLTSSGVTILKQWMEGDRAGKEIQKVKEAQVTLASMGGASNTIPASAFGLTYIRELEVSAEDTLAASGAIAFRRSYDGTLIYAYDMEAATDASRGDVADVSGDWVFIVKGY